LGIEAVSEGQPPQRQLVVTGLCLQVRNDLEIGGDFLREPFAPRNGKPGIRRGDRALQITQLTPRCGELAKRVRLARLITDSSVVSAGIRKQRKRGRGLAYTNIQHPQVSEIIGFELLVTDGAGGWKGDV
jgi:hypothetical protein